MEKEKRNQLDQGIIGSNKGNGYFSVKRKSTRLFYPLKPLTQGLDLTVTVITADVV